MDTSGLMQTGMYLPECQGSLGAEHARCLLERARTELEASLLLTY